VAQRLGPGAPDADVAVLLGDEPLLALGLDARQLQLLAQDLGQLVERQLDFQRVLALVGARLARSLLPRLPLADGIAHLPRPLPGSPLPLAAEAKARNVDLRQRNGDQILALAPDQLAVGDVLAQVLLDLAAHDVAEPPVVGIDPQGHAQITTSASQNT
jgi:hypothetical protein